MMRIFFLLFTILIIACNQQETSKLENTHQNSSVEITKKQNQHISFSKLQSEGILIGERIKLLDNSLKVKRDISNYKESFVEILAVSDSLFKAYPNDDYCEEFKYVKIKSSEFEGIVDGRNIYQLIKSSQNKKANLGDKEIEIIATQYFGIGVSDEDGLTFCSSNTPAIFIDKSSSYKGLVKMVKNEFYDSKYPYFELEASNMAVDKIINITESNSGYLLEIKREYQEGGAILKTELRKNEKGEFIAKILSEQQLE